MIEAKNVSKSFGDILAVDNVSVTIREGSVFGMIGTNGAGKSTFLRMAAGVFRPDSGTITLDDMPVYENPAAKQEFFYISDDQYFFANTTPKELMRYYSVVYPKFDKERMKKMLAQFNLEEKRKVATFSKGMKKQLSVICGICANTKYLFCDETFDGLDPHKKEILRKLLLEYMNETEASVIISSHDLSEISGVCDSIAIINGKNVVLNCAIEDISEHFRKVKLMFTQPVTESKFSGINHRNLKLSGRIATLLVYGNPEEEIEKLEKLNPETIETELLTLEEVFSIETEAVTDYDKIKTIFK